MKQCSSLAPIGSWTQSPNAVFAAFTKRAGCAIVFIFTKSRLNAASPGTTCCERSVRVRMGLSSLQKMSSSVSS